VHFSVQQTIDAPFAVVQGAFLDRRFYEALDDSPNLAVRDVLDRTERGSVVEIRVRFAFTGNVSSAVRAIVDPAKLSWVTVIRFDSASDRWDFELIPDHYPDRLKSQGTYRLLAKGDQTMRTTEGDLKIRVPLFGSTAERSIISGFREHLEREAQLLTTWAEPG
jgi:hypothetical protein